MPKKKQPFICFCESMRYEPGNARLGLPQLVQKYGDVWKNMSPEERRPYEEQSKTSTMPPPPPRRTLLSCVRNSIDDEIALEHEADLYQEYLTKLTEAAVCGVDIDELKGKSFFIASFNIMCVNDEGEYLANEVGIVEYTIRGGIVNYYHDFIDPGDIPVGYAWKAKQHSESTHKIPTVKFANSKGNERLANGDRDLEARRKAFSDMMCDIFELIKKSRLDVAISGKNPMMVFCLPGQIAQVKGCFKFLCKVSEEFASMYDQVEVLNLIWLLAYLCERIGKPRLYAACEGDLNLSSFDYSPRTNCAYHDEIDCPYCALGVAKRWCYMLSDVLCKLCDVSPTEKHLPPQFNEDFHVEEFVPRQATFNHGVSRDWKASDAEHVNLPPRADVRPPKARPPMGPVADKPEDNKSKPEKSVGIDNPRVMGIGRGIRRPKLM